VFGLVGLSGISP